MNPSISRLSRFVVACALLCLPFSSRAVEDGEEPVAPATSNVVIPATAGAKAPVVVGKVKAGQIVTLKIGRVLWGGGGTEGKRQTNWRGYPHRQEHNGLPWMALVAVVNHKTFLPDKKEYTFTIPEDGVLALFANDDNPDGNSGKGEVMVLVTDRFRR